GQQMDFFTRLLDRLATAPGVQAVGLIDTLPLAGGPYYGFFIQSRPPYTRTTRLAANFRIISPDYFHAMGIPLNEGRLLTPQDTGAAPGVVVINQALAGRDFRDQDPIGQRLAFGSSNGTMNWLEIVGVVADVRNDDLTRESSPEVYVSYLQRPNSEMSVAGRSPASPQGKGKGTQKKNGGMESRQPGDQIQNRERRLYRQKG